MVKRKDIGDQLIWTRPGDHRLEGDNLIEKNASENGRLIGNPSLIVRKYPAGIFTVLSADADWWEEEMKFHPEWTWRRGANSSGFLDYLGEAGTKKDDA